MTGNVKTNDTLGDGTAVQNTISNGSATGTYGSIVTKNADGYTYSSTTRTRWCSSWRLGTR